MPLELLHREITAPILGSFFQVYRDLGFGFLEPVYANSLAVELGRRGIDARREVPVEIHYAGVPVGTYRLDMIVSDCVVVEVKAANAISVTFEKQLMNYLRATDLEVGLLLNFGPVPKHKRVVYSNIRKNHKSF